MYIFCLFTYSNECKCVYIIIVFLFDNWTVEFFHEQLYIESCELLLKMIDTTNDYERLTK